MYICCTLAHRQCAANVCACSIAKFQRWQFANSDPAFFKRGHPWPGACANFRAPEANKNCLGGVAVRGCTWAPPLPLGPHAHARRLAGAWHWGGDGPPAGAGDWGRPLGQRLQPASQPASRRMKRPGRTACQAPHVGALGTHANTPHDPPTRRSVGGGGGGRSGPMEGTSVQVELEGDGEELGRGPGPDLLRGHLHGTKEGFARGGRPPGPPRTPTVIGGGGGVQARGSHERCPPLPSNVCEGSHSGRHRVEGSPDDLQRRPCASPANPPFPREGVRAPAPSPGPRPPSYVGPLAGLWERTFWKRSFWVMICQSNTSPGLALNTVGGAHVKQPRPFAFP